MFYAEKLKGSRISKEGIRNLISYIKNLIDFTPEDDPSEVIKQLIKVLEEHLKSKYDNWQERIEDLNQLSLYAQNFPTIRKFLENLSLNLSNLESKTVKSAEQTEEENPLVLSTVHRAKGLEWRVVFIPMLCEGSFPSSRSIGDPESFEEERRVFYVAITRAKDQLYLISPSIKPAYRGPQIVRLSQFVSELNTKVYKKSSVEFKSKINIDKTLSNRRNLFKTADELLEVGKPSKKKVKNKK